MKGHYEGKGCKCFARSKSECSCSNVDWTDPEIYELKNLIKERDATISALRAQVESKWISVEDRLPDELQYVLSFDDFNGIGHTIYRAKAFKKANVVWEQKNVTHWMPLPAPPELLESEK